MPTLTFLRRTRKSSVQNIAKCPQFSPNTVYITISRRKGPHCSPDSGIWHWIVYKQLKKLFAEMGLCQNASSPWFSALHIILKKDGSLCPCGDYRPVNMQTEPDHYPLPNIADVTTYLYKQNYFHAQPPEGILSCAHEPRRHSQGSHHHPLRGTPSSLAYRAQPPTTEQSCSLVRQGTFSANEVSFCGHLITPEGVHPLHEKVAPYQNFPMPSTVKAL
ncbi:uncharacterized protein [Palaemon carinicauda]|uniref:uncharacterized protein n=1 Tax=Palaemon carinicauda TaxID=392227 RepID=UPI0035B604C6